MKFVIPLLSLLLTTNVGAVWSGFAYVTPATQEQYQLEVEFKPVSHQDNVYYIRVRAVEHEYKHAWLISTAQALTRQEQQLRAFIWEDKPLSKKIRLKTRLRPIRVGEDFFYEVELDSRLAGTSYIYMDFPSVVLDGGYFYSIDLGAYLAKIEKAKN